jgi:hypothetical protein
MIYVIGLIVLLTVLTILSEIYLDIDEDYDERKSYEKYKSKH